MCIALVMWTLSLCLCVSAVLAAASGRSSPSCSQNEFRSRGQCSPCTQCPSGQQQAACQPFQDSICVPAAPETAAEAHQRRLTEESLRRSLQRSKEFLHVEMTRMENLVYEWQISVFVISILVTFALVFSCFSMLVCRARSTVRKGLDDYSHLIDKDTQRTMESLDQGALVFADFDRTKIGPCAADSPYGQQCSTVRAKSASSRVNANYKRLSQSPV